MNNMGKATEWNICCCLIIHVQRIPVVIDLKILSKLKYLKYKPERSYLGSRISVFQLQDDQQFLSYVL